MRTCETCGKPSEWGLKCEACFLAQVPAGYHFSIAELRAAFKRVANRSNWKSPVDTTVSVSPRREARQVARIIEGIAFVAGGGGQAVRVGREDARGRFVYRITAPGYYATCGS